MSIPVRRILSVLAVALGCCLLAAGFFAAPRWGAIRCLLAFQDGVPEDLEEGGPAPGDLELLLEAGGPGEGTPPRRAWLLRHGRGKAPTIVFVHGVAREGLRDGRILQAVRAFGRAGFTVVAPELPTMVDPIAPARVGEVVERTLEAVARGAIPGADPRRIGVVGISVGGALALRACALHRAAGRGGLQGILLIGAPDDVRRTAVEWFAAEDPERESDGSLSWERRHAAAFARNYLLRAGLPGRFGRGPQVARLAAWMGETELPEAPLEGVERPELMEVARLLKAASAERSAAREAVLAAAADRIEALSPALWSSELASLVGVPVFLLHGVGDPLVPPAEAAHLARRLRAHTLVTVLESHLVGHTTLHEVSLAERLAHVVFMDDVLDMVGR